MYKPKQILFTMCANIFKRGKKEKKRKKLILNIIIVIFQFLEERKCNMATLQEQRTRTHTHTHKVITVNKNKAQLHAYFVEPFTFNNDPDQRSIRPYSCFLFICSFLIKADESVVYRH